LVAFGERGFLFAPRHICGVAATAPEKWQAAARTTYPV